jgi:hypothetical protein
MPIHSLPRPCLVQTARSLIVGLLYMQNERVVVLLNHVRQGADLRPRWSRRVKTIVRDADARIIPRASISRIRSLQRPNLLRLSRRQASRSRRLDMR